MPEKETYKQRHEKIVNSIEYQKKVYRNKISAISLIAVFIVVYPISIGIEKMLNLDPYMVGMAIIIPCIFIAISIGDYKTKKKFKDK